jgi:hypothetical protein
MDETGVRSLLQRVADDPAPPSRVDIAAARQRGRRRIRWHRAALGAAPLAAAAAVALVVSGVIPASLGFGKGALRPGPVTPRSRFNPVLPYAAFGWLPAGFTAAAGTGMGGSDEVTTLSATLTVGDRATGRLLTLTVSAAGACRLTGPQRGRVLVPGPTPSTATVTYAHALSCQDGLGQRYVTPLRAAAPKVGAGAAFYLPGGGLAWEYTRDSWAQLVTGTTVVGMNPRRAYQAAAGWESRPASQGFPTTVQSAATRALLHKVAGWVRYGARAPVVFPFQLSALPAGWSVTSVTYGVAYGLRVGTVNLSAGPAESPAALNVQVQEATEQKHCSRPAGTQVVSVHGAPAYLYANLPGHRLQTISACHAAGLGFGISLALTLPGSHRPVPGLASLGGVLRVARGMRLLGPDRDAWTAHPVR